MASPPAVSDEKAHLLSLVAQSKHALQEGEALCSRANMLSNASAQDAFDVLALNSKIRWISDAVLEQLKVWLAHKMDSRIPMGIASSLCGERLGEASIKA